MHIHQLDNWKHDHLFVDQETRRTNERRTLLVVLLTLVMMVAEISAGMIFNSMALLADGWHMATHAGALGLAVFAYRYARHHAKDRAFTFGVGKVEILGGYTSAVILGIVALIMAIESVERLFNPLDIAFNEAMIVATLGLIVNLLSAYLLRDDHHHHHHHHNHGHAHEHHGAEHHHHDGHEHHGHHDHLEHDAAKDQNLRAAYLHVLADALTSVLAILALLLGKNFGWNWMDAAMGLVGAVVISKWAWGLIGDTSGILLDRVPHAQLEEKVKDLVEGDADNRLVDCHILYVGADRYAAILSVVTHYPRSAEHYKTLLRSLPELTHVSIEVNVCTGKPCIPVPDLDKLSAAGA